MSYKAAIISLVLLVHDWFCYTPFTRYNQLSNRCTTGLTTGLTTGWMFLYMIKPVVQPVIKAVWQTVWHQLYRVYKHSTGWFDNRLHRVNGVLGLVPWLHHYQRKRLAGKTSPEVPMLVSSGALNINSINQFDCSWLHYMKFDCDVCFSFAILPSFFRRCCVDDREGCCFCFHSIETATYFWG